MKLYLLTQNENNTYDTYDACVVCAKNEADAKTITPRGKVFKEFEQWTDWANTTSGITCEEIGEANSEQQRGVILSSFNVG